VITVVALSNVSLLLQMVGEDKRVKSWKIHTLYLCYKLMRFETSKNSYQTGQCHFPQENILHIYLLQLSTLILLINFQTIYDRKKEKFHTLQSDFCVCLYQSKFQTIVSNAKVTHSARLPTKRHRAYDLELVFCYFTTNQIDRSKSV